MDVELLTALEVGKALKCSRSQVYKLRSAGLLPAPVQVFPGRRGRRWLRHDVEQFIFQARSVAGTAAPRPFIPVDIPGL